MRAKAYCAYLSFCDLRRWSACADVSNTGVKWFFEIRSRYKETSVRKADVRSAKSLLKREASILNETPLQIPNKGVVESRGSTDYSLKTAALHEWSSVALGL
ncbi:hypothetical protein TNCV_4382871 [Trichonephila clavipes]|nr:hypothetical protein TNCV_4382871 [Trichonephila clavipes]